MKQLERQFTPAQRYPPNHHDRCRCMKPAENWGHGGWHHRFRENGTIEVYERCPPYWEAKRKQLQQEQGRVMARRAPSNPLLDV